MEEHVLVPERTFPPPVRPGRPHTVNVKFSNLPDQDHDHRRYHKGTPVLWFPSIKTHPI